MIGLYPLSPNAGCKTEQGRLAASVKMNQPGRSKSPNRESLRQSAGPFDEGTPYAAAPQPGQPVQLEWWQADVAKLKAQAKGANADTQLDLNQQIETLERKIEAGKTKLTELTEASEEFWDVLVAAIDDLISKFQD